MRNARRCNFFGSAISDLIGTKSANSNQSIYGHGFIHLVVFDDDRFLMLAMRTFKSASVVVGRLVCLLVQ